MQECGPDWCERNIACSASLRQASSRPNTMIYIHTECPFLLLYMSEDTFLAIVNRKGIPVTTAGHNRDQNKARRYM